MSEPLSLLIPGEGTLLTRSGWGPDDTLATFGPMLTYGSHGDRAAGSFMLYRGGWLAAKAGLVASSGIAQDVEQSNCLQVGSQQQTFGQTGSAIKQWEDQPGYTYALADLTAAYSGQLDQYFREFLFIRPGYLVVRDYFTVTNPTSAVQWNLQTLTKPAVSTRNFQAGRLFGVIAYGGLVPVVTTVQPAGQATPSYRISVATTKEQIVALEAGAVGQAVTTLATSSATATRACLCGSTFAAWFTSPLPWTYQAPTATQHLILGATPLAVYQVNGAAVKASACGILSFSSQPNTTITITQGAAPAMTFGGYRDSKRNPCTSIQAGQGLIIVGNGFGTATPAVTFLGATATLNSWSDTEINVTVPNLGTATVSAPPVVNGNQDPYPLTVLPGMVTPPPSTTYTISGTVTKQSDGTFTGPVVITPKTS